MVNPISMGGTQEACRDLEMSMRRLNHSEHKEITRPLTQAYTAGAMDGDGSYAISIHDDGFLLEFSLVQKYKPICEAMQKQDGHVSLQDGQFWRWRILSKVETSRFLGRDWSLCY